MKLKQKLYDLLASHKAKVGEARTAVESGDLDKAEELTKEAQDLRQFSVKVSDSAVVGDFNAFERDMTIWRGSLRDDCTAWDDEAFVNGYITAPAAPDGEVTE